MKRDFFLFLFVCLFFFVNLFAPSLEDKETTIMCSFDFDLKKKNLKK